MILKPAFTPSPPQPAIPPGDQTQQVSRLFSAVAVFMGERMWRLRTLLAVMCAVSVVFLETVRGVVFSGVILLVPMDCALLLYAVLAHCPSPSGVGGGSNPLGKLSLLKVPLMFLHPASAEWFDPVCLSLLLVGLVLCDVLFMIFGIVSVKCILTLFL